ncbi:MAG TPA: hypothetical protein VG895_00750 [Patescibacteria group bacterium]|nr:hypothetical protein [Patescibacteria group bacterium]
MLSLLVKNRDKIVFQGEVDNITSYNKSGIFDILDDHSNFISIIEKQIIFRQRGYEQQIVVDTNALIKVRENRVWIYLGIK